MNSFKHVAESTFDPVNNLLTVKVHKGMVDASGIIEELKNAVSVVRKGKAFLLKPGLNMKQ